MFNALVDSPAEYIVIGEEKIKVNTGFIPWMKALISSIRKDEKMMEEALVEIFGEIPKINPEFITVAMVKWMTQFDEKIKTKEDKNETEQKDSIDWDKDGSIIFSELWQFYPDLMKRGINFFEGLELINRIVGKGREQSELSMRVFARCGDFSKMGKDERAAWQKLRRQYAIKKTEDESDFANAFNF